MHAMISFWGWVYAIGLATYAVLAFIVIPLGWKDLVRLFRRLQKSEDVVENETMPHN